MALKGKRKLWGNLFLGPVLVTLSIASALVFIREWWMVFGVPVVALSWIFGIRDYRRLMKNPFIYLWFLQEELDDLEPQAKEDCALWRDNGGFCKPIETDVCLRCSGYQKKGKRHANPSRVSR